MVRDRKSEWTKIREKMKGKGEDRKEEWKKNFRDFWKREEECCLSSKTGKESVYERSEEKF